MKCYLDKCIYNFNVCIQILTYHKGILFPQIITSLLLYCFKLKIRTPDRPTL